RGTGCTEDGHPCALDQCDGTADTCQHPAGHAGTECRAAAGACDVAETCTGTSTDCPADAKRPAGTECRAAAGDCDVGESCAGSSDDCPAVAFTSSRTESRRGVGPRDAAVVCTGASGT